jgi:hypothetical protein
MGEVLNAPVLITDPQATRCIYIEYAPYNDVIAPAKCLKLITLIKLSIVSVHHFIYMLL